MLRKKIVEQNSTFTSNCGSWNDGNTPEKMKGSILSIIEDDNKKSCQTYDDNLHLPDDNLHLPDDRELHENIENDPNYPPPNEALHSIDKQGHNEKESITLWSPLMPLQVNGNVTNKKHSWPMGSKNQRHRHLRTLQKKEGKRRKTHTELPNTTRDTQPYNNE